MGKGRDFLVPSLAAEGGSNTYSKPRSFGFFSSIHPSFLPTPSTAAERVIYCLNLTLLSNRRSEVPFFSLSFFLSFFSAIVIMVYLPPPHLHSPSPFACPISAMSLSPVPSLDLWRAPSTLLRAVAAATVQLATIILALDPAPHFGSVRFVRVGHVVFDLQAERLASDRHSTTCKYNLSLSAISKNM